jgi:membrane protease YdiL (CAAX protease family)
LENHTGHNEDKPIAASCCDISRLMAALGVAMAIAVIAIVLPKLVISAAIPKLITTQGLELTLSLLAIAVLGKRRFSDYGFRLPATEYLSSAALARWVFVGLAAMAVGAVATLAILLTGAKGNPIAGQLTFPQIILFVWVFSSVIEEVFTRGFLQSHVAGAVGSSARIPVLRVDLPTFISALFFACMHLVLLMSGADFKSTVIILLFTFSLGLLAGHQRARTGSLVPAIAVHVLANIGGVIGGIGYTIMSILLGGHPPGR